MTMTEYERDFITDSISKKNIARNARYTRNHCGKSGKVRLPSDNLSKKELKAMSGECVKYASLKKPMSWEEFKNLPNDLKKEYITAIRRRFGVPDKYIAEMFGVAAGRFALYVKDVGCQKGMGNGNKNWAKEEFLAWRAGADLEAKLSPVETPQDDIYSCSMSDEAEKLTSSIIPVIPDSGTLTFRDNNMDDILQTVATLLNCGCGVRYNCTLSWECIVPDEGAIGDDV